jgi:hypothetical protein
MKKSYSPEEVRDLKKRFETVILDMCSVLKNTEQPDHLNRKASLKLMLKKIKDYPEENHTKTMTDEFIDLWDSSFKIFLSNP